MSTSFDVAAFEVHLQSRMRRLIQHRVNSELRNKSAVNSAVDKIYSRLGFKPPLIVWCQDLSQILRLPMLVSLLSIADLLVLAELKKIVRRHTADPSFKQLWLKVSELVSTLGSADGLSCLGRNLDDRIVEDLQSFDEGFKPLNRVLALLDRDEIPNTILRMVRFADGQFQAASRLIVPFQSDGFLAELNRLLTMLPIASQEENIGQITGLADLNSHCLWGVWTAHARLDFMVLGIPSAFEFHCQQSGKPVDNILPWFDLLEGGFAYRFFENYCFVCELPSSIVFDNDLSLHCENGPAIVFSDSQKLYAWHGTIIPENLIEQRKRISPILIERQQNVELRRIMIEIYGLERFIRNSKARMIQQDKYGALYRINLAGSEPLVVLAVSNSTAESDGTRRRYTLRVPPNMSTAREAVAWTFGLRSEEYEPTMES